MKILILNSGSSSLKYKLFENEKILIKGQVDAIGKKNCEIWIEIQEAKIKKPIKIKDHNMALKVALKTLTEYNIIKNLNEIKAIGHRVVHGGEYFSKATIINNEIIKKIKQLSDLAPLHNPHNLSGIIACKKLLPKVKQIAVFDTSFHQTMPEKAFLYGLPLDYYKKFGIRKYGFHGTSHKYVSEKVKKLKFPSKKMIVCHLGNGCSITAIKNGKSIDTSMGFTPLEGLVMGTRSGSIDPAVVLFLQEKKMSPKKIDELLNKKSGLLGLSGKASDMRTIYDLVKKGNKKAKLAFEIFCYKTAFYIGGYTTIMQGLDSLVFTAGIGEGGYFVRKEVCKYLTWMGLEIDLKKNKNNKVNISGKKSKISVLVIPTNEELEIVKEVKKIIKIK